MIQKKAVKLVSCIFFSFFLLFFLVSAQIVIPISSNDATINIKSKSLISQGNYSQINVNNSLYWQGHTGTDGSWLTGILYNYNQTIGTFNQYGQWWYNQTQGVDTSDFLSKTLSNVGILDIHTLSSSSLQIGNGADSSGSQCTALGPLANCTATNCFAMGTQATCSGVRSVVIGNLMDDLGVGDIVKIGVGGTALFTADGLNWDTGGQGIKNTGNIVPFSTNTKDIGSTSLLYRRLYATNLNASIINVTQASLGKVTIKQFLTLKPVTLDTCSATFNWTFQANATNVYMCNGTCWKSWGNSGCG